RGFGSRLRATALIAATIGALSAAAGVVMEGAEAAGVSGFSALKWTIVHETLETKFGTIWGLAVLAWLAFGLLAAAGFRRPAPPRPNPLLLLVLATPPAYIVLV